MRILIMAFLSLVFTACETFVNRDYYSNGTLKEEFSVRNGKFNGKYSAFYDSGIPRAKGEFKNDMMSGVWQYYYPNGKIQSIQEFKNGITISIDYWDISGVQTIKDGTGVAKQYSQCGKIESIMSYKDNVLHGKCETWFPNGVKATESFYKNGQPIGTWLYWNEFGELIKKESF